MCARVFIHNLYEYILMKFFFLLELQFIPAVLKKKKKLTTHTNSDAPVGEGVAMRRARPH